MNRKKDILIDIDEVIFFSGYLEGMNEYLGTNYKIDDFNYYYIDKVAVPKDKIKDFNVYLRGKDLYENAEVLPGAKETINKLLDEYNVYICSACINPYDVEGSGMIFKNKYDFIRREFPRIPLENIIFTSSKHMIKADIQIDDKVSNLDSSIETRILFPSYHNKELNEEELSKKGIIRAGLDWRTGWKEVEKILISK